MMKKRVWISWSVILLAAGLFVPAARAEVDPFAKAPWTATFGLGYLRYEGDQEVVGGPVFQLKAGHHFSSRWALEGELGLMPNLPARSFDNPDRTNLDGDTWAVRLGVDALLHLRAFEDLRWDPYLSAGVGFIRYADAMRAGRTAGMVGAGAGLFYHFNDEWAARLDVRTYVVGAKSEANPMITAGLTWRWGARPPVELRVVGEAELDSDGDGLPDWYEILIGTDPFNPDTDGDGLTDYEEVMIYHTDPLNPDTDYDGLTDGAEILVYGTDPLNPDTDGGGVSDGHEVIEDGTDPLDPSDDLQLFTLNIEFDYDRADLKPLYFDKLDVVVKVLHRDPEATARIEGHADRRPRSDAEYNRRLSLRRARAVMAYLTDIGGVEPDRLSAHGYGFDRPVAPNDTEEHMQRNRRTEIYIRPGGHGAPPPVSDGDEDEPLPAAEEVAEEEEGADEPPVK